MTEIGCSDDSPDLCFHNGIAFLVCRPISINLELSKRLVEKRLKLFNGKEFPIFLDLTHFVSIDRNARKYLASKEANALITATALFVNDPIVNLVAQVFVELNEPESRIKIFKNREKAKGWLEQYKSI